MPAAAHSARSERESAEIAVLCNNGAHRFSAVASAGGIAFPGLNGFSCAADVGADGSTLFGACTRENADGSVSQCADLTDYQGARLVIREASH
ncbi:MAG: hypothetical protein MJD61_18080 [Proteobacteria bacterium]|nr:hypothetical protein [Pseudomonadota bacterium]